MSKRDLALAPSADIMTKVRHLRNGAWQARLHAVKHLAEICGGAAVPELIERLDDNHSLVRAAAISALGQIGGDEARVALHRFMAEGRPDSPLAAEELANWGEEATPALLYGLEVGTTPVQVAALRALGKIRDPGAVQGIMTALRDPAGPVINAAWEALMRIPGDTALQALVDRLGDWPPSTRISAIRRIGERRFTPAVPALCRQLDDENESVVRAAGFALMDITIPEAHVRALMKPLFNLRGMRHHNDSRLVPPLLLALEHGGHWLRWESSRWLAHIAQTAPCPGLALALPLLKRHLGFFAGTPQPEREVHQRTYDLIDARWTGSSTGPSLPPRLCRIERPCPVRRVRMVSSGYHRGGSYFPWDGGKAFAAVPMKPSSVYQRGGLAWARRTRRNMHRKRFLIPLIAALLVGGLLAAAPAARGEDSAANRIPQVKFTDYRLPNGLRVILSTDKSAPVVAVSVVYDVGSRNERPGRSGFAHLFEHMMFQGSENVGKGEHIMLLQDNGGSMNGTTNQDRTNYFETVPANQLELALFLESDRMRSLDISQANLDNQRAVVQEERRQSYDNRAYGQMGETLLSMLFTSFAYKHSTIGSMADLNAATLEDVRQFFKTYYAPNNACIAVVGDFEEGKAKKLIEKYFGPIPRQTDPPKPDVTESPLTSVQRKTLTDPLARLVRYEMDFKTVQSTHPDAEALEILASILSSGRTGRLYSAITEKRLALAADASSYTGRGPGAFSLEGTLPPGGSVEALEAAFDAEIDKVRTEGVTEAELQKAKTQARARTIVGGGGGRAGLQTALGKANMLAQNAIFWNDPGRFNTQIQRIQAVTAADVKRVANTYLKKDARVVLVDGPATAPTAGGGQ